MTSKNDVNIIFLGSKGAGPAFTYAIISEFYKAGNLGRVLVSSRQDLLRQTRELVGSRLMTLSVPRNLVELSNFYTFVNFLLTILKIFRLSDSKTFVFTMHHIFSLLSLPILRIVGARVIYIIHDFRPHEGDKILFWKIANHFTIKLSCKVIFLSSAQLTAAKEKYPIWRKKFFLIRHPTFTHYEPLSVSEIPYKFDFLFFGRIEKYKGIENLLAAFEEVRSRDNSLSLLVAGMLKSISLRAEISSFEGVTADFRYVPDDEIPKIIGSCRVLVLPYNSATQSGPLMLGATFGIQVVITSCEGLIEQSKDLQNVTIAQNNSVSDLASAMSRALELSYNKSPSPRSIESGIGKILELL